MESCRTGADDMPMSSPGFEVAFNVEHETLVIELAGEIDLDNAEALPAIVAGAVNGDASVRIDIAGVTFLDSALLRSLLICQARLAVDGVDVKVRNASPQARSIFEMTNLASLLE